MLPEKLRTLLGASRHAAPPFYPAAAWPGSPRPRPSENENTTRQSRGLEQFFHAIRDHVGLSILDLSGLNQQNANFITNLGHKLYSEDFMRSLDETFGDEDQSNPGRIDYFVRRTLEFPEAHFDGILVWDVLQYAQPPLLVAALDRLYRIVRPQGHLLAFFHAEERAQTVPVYGFRIQSAGTLMLGQGGMRRPAQLFNNRSLEKLFQRFESMKFFLTREHLREVIVTR